MVQLFIKIPGSGETCTEWGMIELQGELESKSNESLQGKFIGDLHFTPEGIPMLIIGHHILYGKVVNMEKPFAVLTKNSQISNGHSKDSPNEVVAMETNQADKQAHYHVKAIIKKKLIFKTRPKPIIVNLPKKV